LRIPETETIELQGEVKAVQENAGEIKYMIVLIFVILLPVLINLIIVNKNMSAFKYTTASMLQMLDQDIRATWEK
jgi:hypothetical protein